jgi:hypothetical protein
VKRGARNSPHRFQLCGLFLFYPFLPPYSDRLYRKNRYKPVVKEK